jgi:hypothetical protein
LGLKLKPVGMIRNLKADPCHVLHRFGANLGYFRVKGLLCLPAGELEPPPGPDDPPRDQMFGIMHRHEYEGYVSIEPPDPFWSAPDERRWKRVHIAPQHLESYDTGSAENPIDQEEQ